MVNQILIFFEGSDAKLFEKMKNFFKEKDEKKKIENLFAFLIILVVTLIVVNKILKDNPENSSDFNQNQTGV